MVNECLRVKVVLVRVLLGIQEERALMREVENCELRLA